MKGIAVRAWGISFLAGWLFVASVLAAGPEPTQQALMVAIAKRQKEAAAAAIAAGADVNTPDGEGTTPLFLASFTNSAPIVELLLSKGADVKAKSNMRGLSLRLAGRFSNSEHAYELMELLMARSGADGGSGRGLTALHGAAAAYQAGTVKILLMHGAEPSARDSDGNTALMWAAAALTDRSTAAEELVAAGADVNARNRGGLTPLHAASAMANSVMQTWLLKSGAEIDARDRNGWTALDWAALRGRDYPTTELTKRGASRARSAPANDTKVEDVELLRRLERSRLPLTARVLGYRDNEDALPTLLRLRDAQLLDAYLPPLDYVPASKFRMTKAKFTQLHPLVKESWVLEATKHNLASWMAASDLPGIEPALLDILPYVPDRARREIERRLAERRYEPVFAHLAKRLEQPDATLCMNFARLGSGAAMGALIPCMTALSKKEHVPWHEQILGELIKHRGTATVDLSALRKALPAALDEKTAMRYYELVGLHQEERQVPELLAALDDPDSLRGRAALDALLRFDSEKVQQQTIGESRRLYAAGKIGKPRYDYVEGRIRERRTLGLSKAAADLAHRFERDMEHINRLKRSAEHSRERRPEEFARDYEKYLAALAALGPKYHGHGPAASIASDLLSEYSALANFVRFRLKQPRDALALYLKAKSVEERATLWIDIQLADTYQYAIGDLRTAIEHYDAARRLLDVAPEPGRTESPGEAWFRAWLPHEIEYLKTGRRFAGTIKREDIGAFAWLMFMVGAAGSLGDPTITGQPSELERLAPSHLNFLRAALTLSKVPDEESVRRFLRKHDPGGYWSASFAGMLLALEHQLQYEDEGSRDREQFLAILKDASGRPTALAIAARSIAKAHNISIPPPDARLATPEHTWQLFIQSLKAGDAATALDCLTPGMKAKLETLFKKMTADDLRRMGDSFAVFSLQPGSGHMREAFVGRTVGDKKVAGFAVFVRQAGEWRIDSM